MKVDLSKCKVGTLCKTRGGKEITLIRFNLNPSAAYQVVFSDGICRTYGGTCYIGEKHPLDIVSVCKPERRKVAKVSIETGIDHNDIVYWAIANIDTWAATSKDYTTKRAAIRGARRFCKLIGFDCEVVK